MVETISKSFSCPSPLRKLLTRTTDLRTRSQNATCSYIPFPARNTGGDGNLLCRPMATEETWVRGRCRERQDMAAPRGSFCPRAASLVWGGGPAVGSEETWARVRLRLNGDLLPFWVLTGQDGTALYTVRHHRKPRDEKALGIQGGLLGWILGGVLGGAPHSLGNCPSAEVSLSLGQACQMRGGQTSPTFRRPHPTCSLLGSRREPKRARSQRLPWACSLPSTRGEVGVRGVSWTSLPCQSSERGVSGVGCRDGQTWGQER